MAIFIVENSGKVSYGIKRYICKTMEDIPVEVNGEEIAPGSRIYVSDEEKTYMLNTAGQWVEITEGSGGGGASSIDQLSDVTIASPQDGQVLAYDETNGIWVNVENSANDKMNKVNPTGSGSFSLNRKANTTIGDYSFAEGITTTASGNYSHAENNGTKATGISSHAEGHHTIASGVCSHAEGINTTADGNYSHAEGNGSVASFANTHAEGCNTTASGDGAHAEGFGTIASGIQSHSEGHYTIAASMYQHVSGNYNISDENDTYAEIIGNGTADDARSNARTLDWQGNEILAGDLIINGNQSVTQALNKIPQTALGKLTAGETSITISNVNLTSNSTINVYTSIDGVDYDSITVNEGSVTIVYPVQTIDMWVKIVFFNENNS